MIDVRAIAQKHVSQGPLKLVLAVSIESDIFPEDERRRGLLRLLAEALPFLRVVEAAETDTFSEGRDSYGAGEVKG